MIVSWYAGEGSTVSIVCTQPRRVAAISVAERVAVERGERLGESVGYQARLRPFPHCDYFVGIIPPDWDCQGYVPLWNSHLFVFKTVYLQSVLRTEYS